jgi:uncharacterized repeat protein (TIGR01451 family)
MMSLEPWAAGHVDRYTSGHEDRNHCHEFSIWSLAGEMCKKAHETAEYIFQNLINAKIYFGKPSFVFALLLAVALTAAVVVQMAAGSADPHIVLNKTATPITGQCNNSTVLLTVQGLGVVKPIDAFLVIDVSNSMGYLPSPTSLDYAKSAANSFVDQVLANSSNRVGLVSFSTTSTLVRGLTNNSALLHSSINGLSASGSTNIDAGFWRASSQFSGPSCDRAQVIVLLSDGVANYYGHTSYPTSCTTWPTTHTTCTNTAISTGQSAWSVAAVFTVALMGYIHNSYPQCEWVATDTLQRSQDAGYYLTYNGSELTSIFSQIVSRLTPAARNGVITDRVSNSFNIISGSVAITPSDRGTVSTAENNITWNFNYLSSENFSLKYNVSCKPGVCGVQSVNTAASLYYQKTDCTYNTLTFPSPTIEAICPNCTITAASPVCSNSTGNTASTVTTPGATYSWSITNGVITSANNIQTITYTAGSSGYTNLTVTVTKSSCSKTCTKSITITPLPDCTITATSLVCGNSTGNTASTATSGATYLWSITNGVITSANNIQTITYTAGSTGYTNLTVTVTKSSCSKTCTKSITITPLPNCTITAPISVCYNATGNNASTATSGATYHWTITNGTITSANDTQTITFSAGSSGNITLSVTVSKSGCSKTCTRVVYVIPCSRFLVSKIASPEDVRPGEEVTYIINMTNTGDVLLSIVRVVDVLPPLMVYVSDNRSGIVSGNMITWENVGPLDPRESVYIELVAKVNI